MRMRISSWQSATGASLASLLPRSGSLGLGRRRCAMAPSMGPAVLEGWMRPFRCHFTEAVWRHVLVLVCGALLAPGRRTVAAALRVMGLGEAAGFAVYHRVLSHGHWCSRALAHRLLLLLVAAFVPDVPVADSSFSAIALLRGLAPHLTVVTRLRLDAGLYDPPPPRRRRARGRPPVKGARPPG